LCVAVLTPSGHLVILRRQDGSYKQTHAIKAHSAQIVSLALNNIVSILATICYSEGKVKLWDVNTGLCLSVYIHKYIHTYLHVLMHTGTLLHDMPFKNPTAACFFNHNPNTLIVACQDGVYHVDVITQTTLPFSNTPQGEWYCPHAVSVDDKDDVVVVGNWKSPKNVCGYDTASRSRKWIQNTASYVGAVCTHHAQVLVSVYGNPTLVLDLNTGTQIAEMHKAEGHIYGLGVIEGVFFISS
jgi:WD40 repeat protein